MRSPNESFAEDERYDRKFRTACLSVARRRGIDEAYAATWTAADLVFYAHHDALLPSSPLNRGPRREPLVEFVDGSFNRIAGWTQRLADRIGSRALLWSFIATLWLGLFAVILGALTGRASPV